jgi:hypothetical protein
MEIILYCDTIFAQLRIHIIILEQVCLAVRSWLYSWGVKSSNLGRDLVYPDWEFHGLPVSPQANSGIVPRFSHGRFLPNPFKYISKQPSFRPTIYRLDSDSAVK